MLFLAVCAAVLAHADPHGAPPQETAHLYAYRVTDRAAFEDGYRLHLAWHEDAGDQLAWYGWYVISGQREGVFIDGTFGTTPEALDHRVDPPGDAANFRATAGPYSQRVEDGRWTLWSEVSQSRTLEERKPAPLIEAHLFVPSDAPAFEAAVQRNPGADVAWYRSADEASYLAIVPGDADHAPDPHRSLGLDHPLFGVARVVRSEAWRLAPHLTMIPASAD